MFIEIPATNQSLAQRKPVFGAGINDADYITQPTVNGKKIMCPYYQRWHDMIKRCYCKKALKKRAAYIGCTVCDEWIYFSNFKKWMQTKNWKGMHLDKDIINPGNKIYSPDNCVFVDQPLNALLTDHRAARGEWPQGVIWHSRDKKFQAQINYLGKRVHIGYFSTSDEASAAYIELKVKIILKAAEKQTDERISSGLKLHAKILQSR